MMQSVSSSPHFHLVLLGQVGAGKSATGNTILGKNSFKSRKSLKAVTQELQKERVTIDGLCFDIYDTPGFFSPGVQKKDIKGKCQEVLHLNASVPTVFLFVVSTDRFTEQEKKTADIVVKFLGGKHLQNTWILFTKGDELQSNEVTIEEYMEDSEDLKDLVKKLHNRYHVFTNKMSEHDPNNKKQVDDLIVKIRSTNSSICKYVPVWCYKKHSLPNLFFRTSEPEDRQCAPSLKIVRNVHNVNLVGYKVSFILEMFLECDVSTYCDFNRLYE
ncbi:putative GTPase IMAP family member 4-like [Triplophysa rosa]|uniref:GTPase IMAP family member 4-like n=1 Tax=Triplophysa rosa TaxID=992332 RepID=A0A9W7WLK6_TRIRA|nr:putative GTPase IMAP family member 4-like [Triplophysa rosa]